MYHAWELSGDHETCRCHLFRLLLTVDGNIDICFTEDTAKKFSAHEWHVINAGDDATNDVSSILKALKQKKILTETPSWSTFLRLLATGLGIKAFTLPIAQHLVMKTSSM